MSQIAFRWPENTSYAIEDFIVSDCNREAFAFLEQWPGMQRGAAFLSGPDSSGKTHLACCWLRRVGGVMLDRNLLGEFSSDHIWPGNVPAVLEDVHTVTDEEALFHLLRHVETHGKHLLLTSALPVSGLGFALPDLCSRLAALSVASIAAPDDHILEVFIIKYFSDRQLRVNEEVASYIIKRVERSFAAVLDVIKHIETASLEQRKEIALPLVRKVLQ